MGYNEDFKKIAENHPKCKSCEFYDIDNKILKTQDEYYWKVAICLNFSSGRYKVGHNSICCEFYIPKNQKLG